MKAAKYKEIEAIRQKICSSLDKVCKELGPIQIGSVEQFPDGWRKAAKGRTVWRIVEEAIIQNLKKKCEALGYKDVTPSEEEASIYDVTVRLSTNPRTIYINFKAAVSGKETEKGDISKARKLCEFLEKDAKRLLFIATFPIAFRPNMTIQIKRCLFTPIAWLPDIYVNPSNNGNLQCRQPDRINDAKRRSNKSFIKKLIAEMKVAKKKRERNSK